MAQEIMWPNDKNDETKLKLEKQYKCQIFRCKRINGAHLVTFVKDELKDNIKFRSLIDGRATLLQIHNKEYDYNIINTYGPGSNTQEYTQFATKYFDKIKKLDNAILIGDWNLLLTNEMCNKERNGYHKQKTRLIGHYFEKWIDVHQIIPTQLQYTYTKGQYRARHDRIYTKSHTAQKIKTYEIKATNVSDHDQLRVVVMWGMRPIWGKGTWKINNEILKDEQFKHEVCAAIEIYKANKEWYTPNEGWDILKSNIKEIAQSRSKEIIKQKINELDQLQTELQNTKIERDNGTNIDTNTEKIKRIETKLDEKTKEMIEGERIRSKQEKILHDERPTSYYYKKEKQRGQTKQITILKKDNDEEIETENEILAEIQNFYSTPYSTKQTQQNTNHGQPTTCDKEARRRKLKKIKQALYLISVLEHIGLQGDILEITKGFYTGITSQIMVNGAKTDKINIRRGVR